MYVHMWNTCGTSCIIKCQQDKLLKIFLKGHLIRTSVFWINFQYQVLVIWHRDSLLSLDFLLILWCPSWKFCHWHFLHVTKLSTESFQTNKTQVLCQMTSVWFVDGSFQGLPSFFHSIEHYNQLYLNASSRKLLYFDWQKLQDTVRHPVFKRC